MFVSYKHQKYLGYDPVTKQYRFQYKIVDTDFEKIEVEVAVGVIDTYEKRNLNVAKNLALAFKWCSNKYRYPIQVLIEWNKKYNPKFSKYEQELNKYLILM